MKLPEFGFLSSKELGGIEFILHTRSPYMIARAIKFESDNTMEYFVKKHNLLNAAANVDDYNILIVLYGNIQNVRESPVPENNVDSKHVSVLKLMKEFYVKERIRGNESRNKKYAR